MTQVPRRTRTPSQTTWVTTGWQHPRDPTRETGTVQTVLGVPPSAMQARHSNPQRMTGRRADHPTTLLDGRPHSHFVRPPPVPEQGLHPGYREARASQEPGSYLCAPSTLALRLPDSPQAQRAILHLQGTQGRASVRSHCPSFCTLALSRRTDRPESAGWDKTRA